jgi:D-erythronate 2-dehydrogenase
VNVTITGGAGFIGRKLAAALLAQGKVVGASGKPEPIDTLTLFDTIPVADPDRRVRSLVGDVTSAADVAHAIPSDTGCVFHLAAIVSAGAEADFDLGYRVNLDGTRHVLEAARSLPRPPRLVFASSIAVYGAPLPATVVDETLPVPRTSYGSQKLMGEYLVNDYSRKGYVDGRSLRFPTVMVRPGKPNRAASTWASSIIREPLSGQDAVCPVRPDSAMACISPRQAVAALLRAADLPASALGQARAILLPGIRVTAGEMAAAAERLGSGRPFGRIHWQPDAAIQAIVDGWPGATFSARAEGLGFTADASIDAIVKAFIADDLAAQIRSLEKSA